MDVHDDTRPWVETASSRCPVQKTESIYAVLAEVNTDRDIVDVESDLASDMMAQVRCITIPATYVTKEPLQVMTWSRLHKATQEDIDMMKLTEHIERGFPESQHDVPKEIKEFHKHRHSLHVVNGVVCYKGRLIIQKLLREQALWI